MASSERTGQSGTWANFLSVPEAGFYPNTRGSSEVTFEKKIKATVTFLHTTAKWNIGPCRSPTAPSLMPCTWPMIEKVLGISD